MPKTSKRQSGDREEWWRHDVIYQIYPRSFLDSNSDGVGDLKGICSKLDYIADLGVKTIWLSPIYKSPMKDSGYDIQDFKDIDPIFGTLEDFKTLVKEMKKKGLKLVMDLVLNHTSDQHEWFQKSLRRKEPYSDYYVWARAKAHDGDRPLAPNNWLSVFSGSAWQWSPERGQFYLHQFAREQPDLNYRNPAVLREMLEKPLPYLTGPFRTRLLGRRAALDWRADVNASRPRDNRRGAAAQFWLDLGVDGFRADAVAHLFEDEQLRDEPLSEDPGDPGEPGYGSLRHARTHNLPEAKDVLAELRRLLDLHSARTDLVRRLLMVEVYDTVPKTVEFYGNEDQPLADYPFNFVFIDEVKKESTADDVKAKIELYLKNVPQGKWPNWVGRGGVADGQPRQAARGQPAWPWVGGRAQHDPAAAAGHRRHLLRRGAGHGGHARQLGADRGSPGAAGRARPLRGAQPRPGQDAHAVERRQARGFHGRGQAVAAREREPRDGERASAGGSRPEPPGRVPGAGEGAQLPRREGGRHRHPGAARVRPLLHQVQARKCKLLGRGELGEHECRRRSVRFPRRAPRG
ncbi:maltase 1-like isoform X4 [Bacillus rossius redtenbacheri]|uniref:maltase 1-like isoform X4 n=1 Tax=Bacillus rossius redtenbacheri TaxID=93214 RepID=UPI002FDD3450